METSSRFNSAPWRIAGIYALISACWILFSDKFVAATTSSIEALTRFAVLKGWAFVLATSALIFYLMRREMARFLKVAASQRASEANFRLLVENAPDAVFVQTKSQFAYLNPAAVALFGARDASNLLGTPVMDRYHPDFHQVIRERIQTVNQERQPAPPIEQVYVRMDGGHVSVEVKSVPIEFQGEQGALVFAQDITERKKAEEALNRFELLVENSRDIILFVQPEDGKIIEANTAADAAYLYTHNELISLKVQDLRAPATLDLFPEQLSKADREGILFETIHQRKDGSTFPVEVSSRGATINGRRTLISVCRDITARKLAEGELRESEARFRTLADSMPQLVWTALPDGRLDYFNRRIDSYKGIVKQADETWEWTNVVHPDDLEATIGKWHHALSVGMSQEIEHRLLQADGSYRWHLSRTNPVHDQSGHVVKWYGTSTQIERQKQTEAALALSESRLRLALDAARMSIWEYDLHENHLTWDGAHRELFGVNPDQFKNIEPLERFVHPDDRVRVTSAALRAIRTRNPFGIEFRIILPNAKTNWIRGQGRVVCDQYGQPYRLTGVVWDVSERKRAQQDLMEANRRLDYLVTESPAVVFSYDLGTEPHGSYISRNAEAILGWKPEQILDNWEFWKQCAHPQDLPSILAGVEQLKAKGKHIFEYRFKDANGHYHWIHDEHRIVGEEAGRKKVVGAWWDVTEIKTAQEELKRLAAAIQQAAEIVIITDEKADIVYTNPAFERITGYRQDEVLGKNPRILKSGEQNSEFYREMWAALTCGNSWQGRFVNKKKDGSFYTEEATISPVKDFSGKIVNYVAVKRDISKEIDLEQQFLEAQKMEAIGTLAGGVAHDFNNILAVIIANAEMLELDSQGFSAESKEMIGQIMGASKRAKELVRQILQFSRRGRQEKIVLNMKAIIKETLGLLRASLPTTIQLEPNIDPNSGMILADPTQMQQVLMNLCTNAAHAMEEKGGGLKIGLSNVLTEHVRSLNLEPVQTGYVKLTISDTGQGMQPWILKRIFEPYFTTKETGKGTGLGLSVVHGIVKSHGGDIRVSSMAGKGTIFDVYLPRTIAEQEEETPIGVTPIKGTGRILFVDDELAIVMAAEKMLRQCGYHVKTTTSAIEALKIFRSSPNDFDLLITDLTMPGMTGLELVSAVLDMSPAFPILLCTGFSDWVKEEMLPSLGVAGLLLKPVSIHELAHSVRMTIKSQH